MTPHHSERKHSRFSASGAERWFQCPGSVALSEGLPDKSSIWSLEGTKAHEVLETMLTEGIELGGVTPIIVPGFNPAHNDMLLHAWNSVRFIMDLWKKTPHSEILVETRISLPFIHTEMFGTFDSAILDHFGTLHVMDYKYGAGVPVGPKENLQMIFYALGLAYRYDWNFKSVVLWIIQPRVKGYDGPMFWELSMEHLLGYVSIFKLAVERVEQSPKEYVEGSHCHWCKAKGICPLKQDKKLEKAYNAFKNLPI